MINPHVLNDLKNVRLQKCGCGTVHLTFGATSINLNQEAFIELATKMANAASEMKKTKKNRKPQLRVL